MYEQWRIDKLQSQLKFAYDTINDEAFAEKASRIGCDCRKDSPCYECMVWGEAIDAYRKELVTILEIEMGGGE